MEITNIPIKVWTDLLTGKINHEFEFLAMKILLARLRSTLNHDSSPAAVQKCIGELKAMFIKFGHLPVAQRDLAKILEDGRKS